MRYILARLYGLRNREIETYRKLIEEMVREQKALKAREIALLNKCLENQQKLVEELYDLKKDSEEEQRALFEAAHVPKSERVFPYGRLTAYLGKEAQRLSSQERKIGNLIKKAKDINSENRHIVEVSHSFICAYIDSLSEMRSRIFGYNESGKAQDTISQNIIVNQRN